MRVEVATELPCPCALVEVDGVVTLVVSDELPEALTSALTRTLAPVAGALLVAFPWCAVA